MPSSFQLTPASAWVERLVRAGGQGSVQSNRPESMGQILADLGQEALIQDNRLDHLWLAVEHVLWNHLLPLQCSDGQFQHSSLTHDSVLAALIDILGAASILEDQRLTISLPISGMGEGAIQDHTLHWEIETGYPAAGITGITFFCDQPLEFDLDLRIPPWAQAVQLQQNGSSAASQQADGYVRLKGPWRSGDHVALRFGAPFRAFKGSQNPLSARPLDHAYPGAPPVPNGRLYHGARELILSRETSPGSYTAGAPSRADILCVGVRKDGILLLKNSETSTGSPFERPGDCYASLNPEHRLVVPRALAGSAGDAAPMESGTELQFVPFETAFDQGAG